jgi:hypothetical protein
VPIEPSLFQSPLLKQYYHTSRYKDDNVYVGLGWPKLSEGWSLGVPRQSSVDVEPTTTCLAYLILNLLFILYSQISIHRPVEDDFCQGAKGGTFLRLRKVSRGGKQICEGSPLIFFAFVLFFSFLSLPHLNRGTHPCVDRILSERKRLALIGISIEFPTYYSGVVHSIKVWSQSFIGAKLADSKRSSFPLSPGHRVSHRLNFHWARSNIPVPLSCLLKSATYSFQAYHEDE